MPIYAIGRHALGRTPEEGAYAVSAEVGAFVWTGQDAGSAFNINFETDAGAFVWTGQDADLYSLIPTAEAGSFVWTGQDAGGAFNINFETDAGAFVWTGMDADRAQTKVILRARGSATPFLNLASSGGGRINIRGGRAC